MAKFNCGNTTLLDGKSTVSLSLEHCTHTDPKVGGAKKDITSTNYSDETREGSYKTPFDKSVLEPKIYSKKGCK